MNEQNYLNAKKKYIEHIRNYVTETGGLFPHITVFAEIRHPIEDEKDKPALIHIPIPDEFMSNDNKKEIFVVDILPDLIKEVKKKFIPKGVAWASEAWLRTVHKKDDIKDYKKLPIQKEVIIIVIESENKSEPIIYEILRKGKQVASTGDLVDIIDLKQIENFSNPDSLGGRFSGLFKKFNND